MRDDSEDVVSYLEISETPLPPPVSPDPKPGLQGDAFQEQSLLESPSPEPMIPWLPPQRESTIERAQNIFERTPTWFLVASGLCVTAGLFVLPRLLMVFQGLIVNALMILRVIWLPLFALVATFYILNWYYYKR